MLAERILNTLRWRLSGRSLLPFRLAWRKASHILLTTIVWCRVASAHHVHPLTLHDATESAGIRHHFLLVRSWPVREIVSHHFVLRTSTVWIHSRWATYSLRSILTINRRLRSDSVFRRSRARLLRVGSALLHHQLSTEAVLLLMTDIHRTTYQIIVRLSKTKSIRRCSIVWTNQVLV